MSALTVPSLRVRATRRQQIRIANQEHPKTSSSLPHDIHPHPDPTNDITKEGADILRKPRLDYDCPGFSSDCDDALHLFPPRSSPTVQAFPLALLNFSIAPSIPGM